MPRVTDIAELDSAQIQQSLEFIRQLVVSSRPELDATGGALTNLLLLPSAEHAAANQLDIARYVASGSLQAIQENGDAADAELVDAVLSNTGVVRRSATFSQGDVVVVVSKRLPLTIPAGSVFTGGGFSYRTALATTVKTSAANVDAATDQVLLTRSDGNYSFTLPVVAVTAGSATALKRGTVLESENVIANLVAIYVDTDFTGGEDAESNSQLILRQAEGVAAKTPGNRVSCAAFLRASAYSGFTQLSIIGAGDVEMLRDRHTIFPGSFGGRTDWYVRTAADPIVTKLTKTCTLVEKTSDGFGIWQCAVARDDFPGFYDVTAVCKAGDASLAGYEVVIDLRDIDLTGLDNELLPDIANSLEGAFSRYQTAIVRFKDTDVVTSSLTVGSSQAAYDVYLRGLPHLAEIQQMLSTRGNRGLFGDVLVKSPVPCFVSLGFTLYGPPGAPQPDLETLKSALVSFINRAPFSGRLFASDLTKVIYDNIPTGLSVSALSLLGRLLQPNGTRAVLHHPAVLEIPQRPAIMVTSRTVGFVTAADLINISVGILNSPDIL